MKAIRIHGYGNSSQLKVEDIPRPKPKSGYVLVKIHDAGINPFDWKVREGYMKDLLPLSFPLTMGRDFSGEIEEVGADVTRFKVGDLVFGFASGSYAEYAIAAVDNIAKIPESLGFAVAAALPTAGLTAWQIIQDVVHPSKDQLILIHGAAGGVGSFASQLACAAGASVFATASSADRDYLSALGVKRVIDYKSEKFDVVIGDMLSQIRGRSAKEIKLDAVIDLVGGDTLARSYALVKKGGVIVTTVGTMDQKRCQESGINGVQFLMKPNAGELDELARQVDRRRLNPRVSEVLPLNEARKAQDLSQTGKSHGKVVLEVIREQLEPTRH
jgi:NADPH:quinone reductase-like Zn-dependent oxidoreductase